MNNSRSRNPKKKTLSLSFFFFFLLQVAASASSEIVLPNKYCESIFKTVRRPTRTINVSESEIGVCGRKIKEKREEKSEQSRDEASKRGKRAASGAPL